MPLIEIDFNGNPKRLIAGNLEFNIENIEPIFESERPFGDVMCSGIRVAEI